MQDVRLCFRPDNTLAHDDVATRGLQITAVVRQGDALVVIDGEAPKYSNRPIYLSWPHKAPPCECQVARDYKS